MDLHISYVAAFGDEGTCAMAGQDKTIVANHNAYSYMSVAYDIEIITLHGLDPKGEPSPADIAEVVEITLMKKELQYYSLKNIPTKRLLTQ